MTGNDDVSLTNIAHPRSRFWWLTWIWYWFFPLKLNPEAVETIEIEIKPSKGDILNSSSSKNG